MYQVYGWNHLMDAAGLIGNRCESREEAEQEAKKFDWLMDEFEIQEVE